MLSLTISTLTFFLLQSLVLIDAQGIQLPEPQGPLTIGTTSFQLTDHSRLDPFAPTPQNRSVQLSLYYPIANLKGRSLPFSTYIPRITAEKLETEFAVPAGTLQNISTHAYLNAPILRRGRKIPIVLFSPGLGVSRLIYATFAQDLASEGYVVAAIDHPYDAPIVELSDGRVITANVSITPEGVSLAHTVRVADIRFILDELASGNNFKVPNLDKGLDTAHVGFFGHSLGGAAAATAMVLDNRIVAGLNMDGTFLGPDVKRGFAKPFINMASKGHNRTTDASWGEVWPKWRGFKRELEFEGALHLTFSDGPVMTEILGLKAEDVFGTIAGQRFNTIQHAYLKAFFDFALGGKKQKLLDGPSKKFPEVIFNDSL